MDVTVVVATHGDEHWQQLAARRAIPSVHRLGLLPIVAHLPNGTLAEARNEAIARVETPWLAVLDGDDELEPGYFEAMEQGTADLRAPAVRYVPWGYDLARNGARTMGRSAKVPHVVGHHHDCTAECLAYGNWLVIGSMVRTELVREAGGFPEWPVYEDYALWAKCWQLGATVEAVPQAVYRAHVRSQSRNRGSMTPREKHKVHQDIARSLGLAVPA